MRNASLPAGKYVVAVSGGVDSVVLLDLLARQSNLELVVAHFDHGIRADSSEDARLVRELAAEHGLAYRLQTAKLGPGTSEEAARKARYDFLRQVATTEQATLVTAHHQDDLIETALINLTRGTGWRGLCSLRDLPELRRPLLGVPKQEIVAYATDCQLMWREDSTNIDKRYLRNRIRAEILPQLSVDQRQQFLALIVTQTAIRESVESLVAALLPLLVVTMEKNFFTLIRSKLLALPTGVIKEVMLEIVHRLHAQRVPQAMLSRIVWFAATARPHKYLQVNERLELFATQTTVVVQGK